MTGRLDATWHPRDFRPGVVFNPNSTARQCVWKETSDSEPCGAEFVTKSRNRKHCDEHMKVAKVRTAQRANEKFKAKRTARRKASA